MTIEWFPTEQIVHQMGSNKPFRVWYSVPIGGGRRYQAAPLGEIPEGSMGYTELPQLLKLKRLQ